MINGLTDTMQRNKVFEDPLECYLSRLEVRYHDFTRSYGLLDCISFSWEKNLRRSIFRIQLKLNTALLSTVRPFVRASVTGVTSHISHIYKGINAMLIIRGPIKPYSF